MEKALIVAKAQNNVIGNQGQLPWNLPDDLHYFKKMTSGHAIIMGRKTYLSIGHPLPNRLNIVLTRNPHFHLNNQCHIAHTLDNAFHYAQQTNMKKAFVIGGAQVYQEALSRVATMYITEINSNPQGDTYFPTVDWQDWHLASKKQHQPDEKHTVSFTFLCYQRQFP